MTASYQTEGGMGSCFTLFSSFKWSYQCDGLGKIPNRPVFMFPCLMSVTFLFLITALLNYLLVTDIAILQHCIAKKRFRSNKSAQLKKCTTY